jgi:hypothetical protein
MTNALHCQKRDEVIPADGAAKGGGLLIPPRGEGSGWALDQGTVTVVPSPVAEIEYTPPDEA